MKLSKLLKTCYYISILSLSAIFVASGKNQNEIYTFSLSTSICPYKIIFLFLLITGQQIATFTDLILSVF
jgi:hypothetical protein